MGSQGSQSEISIREETVWGTVDPGQFQAINFVSEDMAFDIESQLSNSVRADRQNLGLIQVGASAGGGIDTEFQAQNLDVILPGAMWDTDWNHVDGAGATSVITAGASGSNLDFVTSGGNTLTLGSSVVHDIVAGQVIKTEGFSNSENNGVFKVNSVSTNALTLNTSSLVVETAQATATIKGDRLRNGVTKHSYSIERAHTDISQFFLYKGMVPSTLEFTIEGGNPLGAKVTFIGKDEVLSQTTESSPDAAVPTENEFMNSVSSVGEVAIDGTAISGCLLQKVDFMLDNKVEGKTAVGVLGFCNAEGKSIDVTGNISLYFNDATYYDMYRNATSFALSFVLTDLDGNTYAINLPNCRFDKSTANVTGKDDDVMLTGSFSASKGTDGFTLQLVRALA